MTLESWLHFGHVLGAIAWIGGGLVLALLALRVRRSTELSTYREFAGTLSYVGPRLLLPGLAVTLVFGVLMVLVDPVWDFGQTWILIAIVLSTAAFLVGLLYVGRIGIQFSRAETVDVAGQRRLVDQWLAGYGVVLAILLVIVWDMVFKPGL